MPCKAPVPKVGDVGTDFEVQVMDCEDIVDVSLASVKQIQFVKPDDPTIVSKTAVFSTNGTDGKIKYVSEAGFINVAGVWKMRGHTEAPGDIHSTDWFLFTVSV